MWFRFSGLGFIMKGDTRSLMYGSYEVEKKMETPIFRGQGFRMV